MREERIVALYRRLVERARATGFYRDLGVPDTPDGRFELLAMHVALAMRRLGQLGPDGAELNRALAELMLADMDRSVRELGVGDLSVGKYVKRMAASLYARLQIFDRAVPVQDTGAVVSMLERNIFTAGPAPSRPVLEALAGHLLAFAAALDGLDAGDLLAGRLGPCPASLEGEAASTPG